MIDISANIEFSAGYFNFYRTDTGRLFLQFDFTGGSSERLLAKDPTGGSQKGNCFYIDTVNLVCTSGATALYDCSDGVKIFKIPCSSFGATRQFFLDFRPDSLPCLALDNTQALCISAGNGFISGLITGWFGRAVDGKREATLELVGGLNPSFEGEYLEVGVYNSKPYYYNSVKDSYLWWLTPNNFWIVSDELGLLGASYFARNDPNNIGEYTPLGTATGTGDLHIH